MRGRSRVGEEFSRVLTVLWLWRLAGTGPFTRKKLRALLRHREFRGFAAAWVRSNTFCITLILLTRIGHSAANNWLWKPRGSKRTETGAGKCSIRPRGPPRCARGLMAWVAGRAGADGVPGRRRVASAAAWWRG